jgi:tetratricopeptide (TPR) repeat protein
LTIRPLLAVAALAVAAGCSRSGSELRRTDTGSGTDARVGVDPVPAVHLFENHSDALIAWRRAGVRDRILVHLDGHADLDWLPDATIARLAAADADDLHALQRHPYAVEGKTLQKFGNRDFIYPAARLGIVRQLVWVVPDGTLRNADAAEDLVRRTILSKLQMISLDEAKTLRFENRTVRGTILGLNVIICELGDLPAFDEPVLLDVDLDFLTIPSAGSQNVSAQAAEEPDALVERLRARGVRTDLATVSLSTIGGFLPPSCRWLGPAMVAALKHAPGAATQWAQRAQPDALLESGRAAEAAAALRAAAAAYPDDGSIWYALARHEAKSGHAALAAADDAKAIAADPVLEDALLFEADALWLNQRYADALLRYRDYHRARPTGPFLAYTLRQEAGCLLRTGRPDEAIALLRRVIAMAPDHADTRLDLGALLCETGDYDGAIAQFLEARRLVPDVAAYAVALGSAYASQDRLNEAVDALEAAVSRRPTWGQAQMTLGLLLVQVSRPVDAAAHLNAASLLAPKDPQIAHVLSRLRRQGITTTEVAAHP